jgi:hypothetical protein
MEMEDLEMAKKDASTHGKDNIKTNRQQLTSLSFQESPPFLK